MTASANAGAVHTRRDGDILVVTLDHPPVNALSFAVRGGLARAIDEAEADPQVRAVLLTGAGKNFIAGADIREFGKPPVPPSLPDVCNRIEACAKPVVAVLQGAALGGGLEVALAAHYRVALASAKLGLPEVTLGLLPGAGGTQRTPRLIGAQAALDLMLSGKPLAAQAALAAGLVDELAPGTDPLAAGLDYARRLLAQGAQPRRSRDGRALDDKAAALAAVNAASQQVASTARGLFSPAKIVEAVRAAIEQPFDEGLRTERALFLQCLDSPQRAGLIHAFFAERDTAKIPELKEAKPRPLDSVGVIGGGTMGAGIVVALLDAGLPTVMVEQDDAALERGRKRVEQVYDLLGEKRPHDGRRTRRAAGALYRRHELRRPDRRRPHHRSRVRGHGRQAGRVRATEPRGQAGRGAGHQHVLPGRGPHRPGHHAPGRRAGAALLFAGQHHEAAGSGGGPRDGRRHRRHRL